MTFDECLQYQLGDLIRGYRSLEQSLKLYAAQVAEQTKPSREQLEIYKQAIKVKLIESKQNSAATDHGTAYLSEAATYKVEDWEAFFTFVEEAQEPDFLIRGVASTKVKEWAELHDGVLPPGIGVSRITNVNIRS